MPLNRLVLPVKALDAHMPPPRREDHLSRPAAHARLAHCRTTKRQAATTLGAASGAVAGLVAITPCAGYVNAAAATAIGLIAGAVYFLAISLKYRFGYDDALDVIGVHLVGGIVGSLLVGIFATRSVNKLGANGVLAGGGFHLLGVQALAVVVTMAFSFTVTFGIAKKPRLIA